jgi:hypothetical protein
MAQREDRPRRNEARATGPDNLRANLDYRRVFAAFNARSLHDASLCCGASDSPCSVVVRIMRIVGVGFFHGVEHDSDHVPPAQLMSSPLSSFYGS